MPYRIEIVRTGNPITSAEFESCARLSPDLVVEHDDSGNLHVSVKRAAGLKAELRFSGGTIDTDWAETDVIAVMIGLADCLGARVRGDDFETYRTPFETYQHPDDQTEIRAHALARQKQARRRWIPDPRRFAVIGIAIVLGLIGSWTFGTLKHRTITDPMPSAEQAPEDLAGVFDHASVDVLVIPADDFNEDYAKHLATVLQQRTQLSIKPTTVLGLAQVHPFDDDDPLAEQYDTLAIAAAALEVLAPLREQYGPAIAIVLTTKDINASDRAHRFQFAVHYSGYRLSIVSASRLAWQDNGAPASDAVIEERLMKFLLRTVGQQVYRLDRTNDIDSVMYSPIMSVADVDRMGLRLDRPQ